VASCLAMKMLGQFRMLRQPSSGKKIETRQRSSRSSSSSRTISIIERTSSAHRCNNAYERSTKREQCIASSESGRQGGLVARIRVTNARDYCIPSRHHHYYRHPFSRPALARGECSRPSFCDPFRRHSDASPMRVRSDAVARVTCGTTYPSSSASTCTGWIPASR